MSEYDPFAERYDEWSAAMTQDVPFYVGLAGQCDGPLVELAVGTGRVAIPVAQATGRTVIGIDSSPAILHLPTWADRRRTFERVAAALRPGGRFAWNVFVYDHRVAVELEGRHHDHPLPHTIRYDRPDNRVDIILDSGPTTSLWWATKNEWLGLIDVAGLDLEALYGTFDRGPLDAASSEHNFVTRRR